MGWQEDRDRLMADTLAFVRQLSDNVPPLTAPAAAAVAASTARRFSDGDLRTEMQARLNAFRNRQRFLQIEREAYYQQAMQRIRAATEHRA